MRADKARGDQAIAAVDAFISDSLVFLAPGFGKVRDMWVGSGEVISSSTGVVVLTAAHNIEDIDGKPLRLGGRRIRETIDDVMQSIAVHPTEDVALIFLKPHATQVLQPWALPRSSIGTDDDLEPGDPFKLAGFPSEWRLLGTIQETGGVAMGLTSVCYGTNLKNPPRDDRGRLRVDWSERVVEGGQPVKMPHPGGISGGGLWRLLSAPKDAVWHAARAAKLIGVPTSWDKVDTEFVVPVSRWGPWLSSLLPTASAASR
jgi:hypothetical protein